MKKLPEKMLRENPVKTKWKHGTILRPKNYCDPYENNFQHRLTRKDFVIFLCETDAFFISGLYRGTKIKVLSKHGIVTAFDRWFDAVFEEVPE